MAIKSCFRKTTFYDFSNIWGCHTLKKVNLHNQHQTKLFIFKAVGVITRHSSARLCYFGICRCVRVTTCLIYDSPQKHQRGAQKVAVAIVHRMSSDARAHFAQEAQRMKAAGVKLYGD